MSGPALTEDEIGYLMRQGELGSQDLADTKPDEPEPEDTTIKDGIADLVAAIKGIPKPEKVSIPAPQVTVNVPKRSPIDLIVRVLTRDKGGNIETVAFKEVGA